MNIAISKRHVRFGIGVDNQRTSYRLLKEGKSARMSDVRIQKLEQIGFQWYLRCRLLRRQKPSTNALDGLYLPCVDRMLEARWVEGCDESLPRRTGVRRKSRRGFPSPTMV